MKIEFKNMDKISNYLNYIAATILAVVIIGGLCLVFVQFCSGEEPIKKISIEYRISNVDKIDDLNRNEIKKIDSLFLELKNISNNIQKQQIKLIEGKEDENFFNQLYTAIIAIIIAIAGFFGFKSVNDIKERAIEDAKIQAEAIAKKEFNNIFTPQYEAEVTQKVTEILMSGVLKEEIGKLEEKIFELEKKIDALNGIPLPIGGESSKSEPNDESKNPFEKND